MNNKPKNKCDLLSFGDDIDALVSYLANHWEGHKGIKPKGYNEFTKNYTDFDGMEELDVMGLREEFKGCNDATVRSFEFPIGVSLPHVAYDDICQGREPFRTLVAACVRYGMMRGEVIAMEDVEKIKKEVRGAIELLELIVGKG